MDGLTQWTLLYRDPGMHPLSKPLVYQCWAEDMEYADRQCEDANPGCDILWAVDTDVVDAAFQDWYNA